MMWYDIVINKPTLGLKMDTINKILSSAMTLSSLFLYACSKQWILYSTSKPQGASRIDGSMITCRIVLLFPVPNPTNQKGVEFDSTDMPLLSKIYGGNDKKWAKVVHSPRPHWNYNLQDQYVSFFCIQRPQLLMEADNEDVQYCCLRITTSFLCFYHAWQLHFSETC